jgi:hypothetical protein
MHLFGSGKFYATPLTDVNGNAISSPTPAKLGTLQDFSMDISFDTKMLYGGKQFALDIGRGKAKLSAKAKAARITGAALSVFGTGLSRSTGQSAIYDDTTGAAIPGTPYGITPTVPSSGTWAADLGVTDVYGVPYKRVASGPATGEYSVSAGVYTFAAADTTKTVFISFRYTLTTGNKQSLANTDMGPLPTFAADMELRSPQGKIFHVLLNNAFSEKLALASKMDDFVIPEFDMGAIADANGVVGVISSTD